MAWKYLGISSQYTYKRTFDEFKKEFENTWVFQKVPQKERLSELKKAFKIAITDNQKVNE